MMLWTEHELGGHGGVHSGGGCQHSLGVVSELHHATLEDLGTIDLDRRGDCHALTPLDVSAQREEEGSERE
jgi:hypothetical protein